MIVDTHVHIVSPDREKHPLAPNASGWSKEGVVNPVEDLMRLMTESGVDKAVLVQPAAAYGFDNAYHADSQAKHADRTVSVGLLDPVAEDGPDRLTYWISERGMHGVRAVLGTGAIDDGRADAFWKRAGELRIPITIFGATQPAHIMAFASMAARFPEVRIAPDHMAGWSNSAARPEMTAALIHLARSANAYLKISTINIEPYDGYSPGDKRLFQDVLDAFTPRKTMWGSNFPASRVGGYARQVAIGRSALAFLTAEDRAWILGGTAISVWPQLK